MRFIKIFDKIFLVTTGSIPIITPSLFNNLRNSLKRTLQLFESTWCRHREIKIKSNEWSGKGKWSSSDEIYGISLNSYSGNVRRDSSTLLW